MLDVDGDVSEVAGTWLPWYIIPEVYPFAFRGSGARVWFAESDLSPLLRPAAGYVCQTDYTITCLVSAAPPWNALS